MVITDYPESHSPTIYCWCLYIALTQYAPVAAEVTVSIAGIGPLVNLGSEDRNNSAGAPGRGQMGLSTPRICNRKRNFTDQVQYRAS
jgi:hypothetical protein